MLRSTLVMETALNRRFNNLCTRRTAEMILVKLQTLPPDDKSYVIKINNYKTIFLKGGVTIMIYDYKNYGNYLCQWTYFTMFMFDTFCHVVANPLCSRLEPQFGKPCYRLSR